MYEFCFISAALILNHYCKVNMFEGKHLSAVYILTSLSSYHSLAFPSNFPAQPQATACSVMTPSNTGISFKGSSLALHPLVTVEGGKKGCGGRENDGYLRVGV